MRKILFMLSIFLMASYAYAQDKQDNSTAGNLDNVTQANTVEDNATKLENTQDNGTAKSKDSDLKVKSDKKHKGPDFNKKKISLDRIEDKKWSLRLGYGYFFPESKYASIFTHKLKIGGAYDFNKYFQLQALLQYADGSTSFNIGGVDTSFSGTIYNLGLLATGLYPIEVSTGEFALYAGIGGVYTFGNIKSTANNIEQKQNISGGGILAQAGVQYNFNIFSFRVYGEYLYDLTPIKINHLGTLSGISAGAEVGIKF